MLGEDLALTILTGRRPAYLRETVESLLRHARSVVEGGHVTLLVNGQDDETLRYTKGLAWIDELEVLPGSAVVPIGGAISMLYRRVVKRRRPLWFHLEDDWRCVGAGWLAKAKEILKKDRRVGQVRMRHVSDRVLPYHMITHKTIRWKRHQGYKIGHAHYTFNPSIVRVADIASLFPCSGEPDAMRKFVRTNRMVAQLTPGAFVHLGEQSLRAKLSRSR